jgi:hypothetical protein
MALGALLTRIQMKGNIARIEEALRGAELKKKRDEENPSKNLQALIIHLCLWQGLHFCKGQTYTERSFC